MPVVGNYTSFHQLNPLLAHLLLCLIMLLQCTLLFLYSFVHFPLMTHLVSACSFISLVICKCHLFGSLGDLNAVTWVSSIVV